MNIHLHIDELVLHGFAPGDRYRIAEAVQVELSRMLTEGGVPPDLTNGSSADRVDAGSFDVRVGAKPEAVGAGIAQTMVGGLNAWASE